MSDAIATPGRRHPRWLDGPWPVLVPAAVALVVRIGYVVAFGRSPLGRVLFLDAEHYDRWARAIAGGHPLTAAPFFVEPLYAYLLAAIYRTLGDGLATVRLLQAFAGVATVALVALLARRLFGSAAALLAGLTAALYGPFVFFEGLALKTTLAVLASTGSLVLVTMLGAASPVGWLAAGLGLGVAALLRGNLLLLAPVGALWGARLAPPGRLARPAAYLFGVGLAVVPAVALNVAFAGEPAFLTTGAGINLYVGNRAGSRGGTDLPPFLRPSPRFEEIDAREEASRRAGRPLSSTAASRFWIAETGREIRADPAGWLRLVGRKALLVWDRHEAADNLSFAYTREVVPWLKVPFVGFGLAGPLGLAGILLVLWRRRPAEVAVAAWALVLLASVVLFHVADRYRLPAVPPLLVLGAGLVVWLVRALREGRRRRAVAGGVTVALAAALCWLPELHPAEEDRAPYDRLMAVGYGRMGRPEEAAAYDRKAAAVFLRAGKGYLGKGQLRRAELAFQVAWEARPDDPEAALHLAATRELAGDLEGALAVYREARQQGLLPGLAAARIGWIQVRRDEFEAAERSLGEALAEDPSCVEALLALGELRVRQGRRREAREAFERALAERPGDRGIRERLAAMGNR